MSYVLFLAFKSIVYKIPPIVRVSLDNTFLDEFAIDKFYSVNDINNPDKIISDEWISTLKDYKKVNPVPQYKSVTKSHKKILNKDLFFKIFELDEKIINLKEEHTLIIEIFNNDNNHTNGFLTKSTMLSLSTVYLIPKILLLNLDVFYDRFETDRKKYRATHFDIIALKNSYKKKQSMFDLLTSNVKEGNIIPWYNNLNNEMEKFELHQWLGGDGYFKLPFKNKLITYEDNRVKDYSLNESLMYGLFNKYREYENQRNTN
jgi:hypothetical protein